MTRRRAGDRRGLTLIELLLAMIVGLAVLTTVTGYVKATDRTINSSAAREDYTRKARFLGLAVRRDFGEAGVGIESLRTFGTVGVFNDTVTILKVPYEPNADPAYNVAFNPMSTVDGTTNSSAAIGCGTTCLRLRRVSAGTALTLVPGMVARVQQGTVRRLIVINTVGSPAAADSVAVTFTSFAAVQHRPGITSATTGAYPALTGMSNANTTVQRLDLTAYWRDASNNLWRATRINPATGAFSNAEVVATGCTQFDVKLIFQNGGLADNADSTVVGRYNNDINAILVTATFQSDYTDARYNGGQPLKRTYTYRVQPRNLIYERNRDN